MRKFEVVSVEQFNKDFSNSLLTRTDIKLPKRATAKSAGYDIYSPIDFVLNPGEVIKFSTGVKVLMADNEFLAVVPRSGHGFKHFSRLANTIGIIDADYYGNANTDGCIYMKLRNESTDSQLVVKAGDAIAQGIFLQYLITDDDDSTAERVGGLGSTSN